MKKIESILNDNSNKIYKIDKIIMLFLICIYGTLSFYRLGDMKAPQTYHHFSKKGDSCIIKFQDTINISKIKYYSGDTYGTFKIVTSEKNNVKITTIKSFTWSEFSINLTTDYIKIISEDNNLSLGEMIFYDEDGNKIKPITRKDNYLIDESSVLPKKVSFLNENCFDEIYYVSSAYEYVHNLEVSEWTHPPLGKLIIAIPIYLFGFSPFNYRLMGNLAGIFMIALIYILAKKLFNNRKWATLAGLLMIFDNFHFVHTRIALIDSFQIVFILLSVIFMKEYIDCDSKTHTKEYIYLLLSGTFIGCAIDVKWNAVYVGIGLAIVFFIDLFNKKKSKAKYLKKDYYIKLFMVCVISFILIPLFIYVLSYLLFPNIDGYDGTLIGIINQTRRMLKFHSNTYMYHHFSSKWYTWPIMYKPVWLYSDLKVNGVYITISDIGNPVIWWFGIISVIYLFINVIRKKNSNDIFILIFILSSYLPYIFVKRFMFMYHYFITLPFIMLAIVAFIKWITEKTKKNIVLYAYIIIIIICFLIFYPIVSGIPVTDNYVKFTKWLPTWYY